MDGSNRRMEGTEKRTSELADTIDIIQSEQQRKK